MEEINLSEETMQELSVKVTKSLLQAIEKLLKQTEKREDREERLFNVLANADHYIKPLNVEYQKGEEIQKPTTWKKRETL